MNTSTAVPGRILAANCSYLLVILLVDNIFEKRA